jgi:4'-phosphopantetheinyl transferase
MNPESRRFPVQEVPLQAWEEAPERIAVETGAAHVWRVPLDVSAAQRTDCEKLLAPDEAGRMRRMRHPDRQRRFTAGRAQLRRILSRYTGMAPADVPLRTAPNGRPEAACAAAGVPAFSVSHSGDVMLVLVAAAKKAGIDIEVIRPRKITGIIGRYYTDRECRALAALPEGGWWRGFYRIWTLHEAWCKCSGKPVIAIRGQLEVRLACEAGETIESAGIAGTAGLFFYRLAAGPDQVVAAAFTEKVFFWRTLQLPRESIV